MNKDIDKGELPVKLYHNMKRVATNTQDNVRLLTKTRTRLNLTQHTESNITR